MTTNVESWSTLEKARDAARDYIEAGFHVVLITPAQQIAAAADGDDIAWPASSTGEWHLVVASKTKPEVHDPA